MLLLRLLRQFGSEPKCKSPSGIKLQKDRLVCEHILSAKGNKSEEHSIAVN